MSNFVVPKDLAGQTLAAALRHFIPGTPWSKARELCERGKVQLNGARTLDSVTRVKAEDEITLELTAPRIKRGGLPEGAIVYLDDDIVVVNKPAGVLSVPYDPKDKDTLIDQAMVTLGARGKHGAELGAVHRLDKETSGLLMFTRTLAAKRVMQEAFRKHRLDRIYWGIAHGAVEDATHESWLIEDRGDGIRGSHGVFRRATGRVPESARQAVTHVRALEKKRNATLVECTLETGRQHQIRIHLAESGHPLVGERVYIRDYTGEKIGAPRPMLHAYVLGFDHPSTGEPVRFEQEPPEDFAQLLRRL